MENKYYTPDIEAEVWKDISGYENYYKISNKGRILSLSRRVISGNKFGTLGYRTVKEKEKKPFKTNSGYLVIELKKENNSHKFLVHRLVAQAFIPNLNKLPEVNHKNCNKEINEEWNLEWIDKIGNERHAKENGRKKYKGNQYVQ